MADQPLILDIAAELEEEDVLGTPGREPSPATPERRGPVKTSLGRAVRGEDLDPSELARDAMLGVMPGGFLASGLLSLADMLGLHGVVGGPLGGTDAPDISDQSVKDALSLGAISQNRDPATGTVSAATQAAQEKGVHQDRAMGGGIRSDAAAAAAAAAEAASGIGGFGSPSGGLPGAPTSNEGTSNTSSAAPDSSYDRAEGGTGTGAGGRADGAAASGAEGKGADSGGAPGPFAEGGLVTDTAGPDPAGPDEGQISVQKGEFVMTREATRVYSSDLLDAMNRAAKDGLTEREAVQILYLIGRRLMPVAKPETKKAA